LQTKLNHSSEDVRENKLKGLLLYTITLLKKLSISCFSFINECLCHL